MSPRTARSAIRSWFATHPKTHCPVVGQCVCRHAGCDNAELRADPRCNIALKQEMLARARDAADFRPPVFDVRIEPGGDRFILNFGYDKSLIADLKSAIPGSDRGYLAESREWWVHRRHYGLLCAIFSNFADFHASTLRTGRAKAPR